MIEINSVNNPTIKSLRKLEQKKYRKKDSNLFNRRFSFS